MARDGSSLILTVTVLVVGEQIPPLETVHSKVYVPVVVPLTVEVGELGAAKITNDGVVPI